MIKKEIVFKVVMLKDKKGIPLLEKYLEHGETIKIGLPKLNRLYKYVLDEFDDKGIVKIVERKNIRRMLEEIKQQKDWEENTIRDYIEREKNAEKKWAANW